MAVMEFLSKNLLNTTTMVKVDSSTSTVKYLFDRNVLVGYTSSGYNDDTSTIISIELSETTPVSHILIQNHNLKQFRVFYDSATSNSLYATTTNADISTYIEFSTTQVASIQIQMDNTIAGSTEKRIGEIIIAEREVAFDLNPSQKLYNPVINRKQIEHSMPDGGTVLYNIKDKFQSKIGLRFITTSFYDDLLSVFEAAEPITFLPFPTSSSWAGKAYQVVWTGKFDFKFADNAKNTYSGNILLKETPSG